MDKSKIYNKAKAFIGTNRQMLPHCHYHFKQEKTILERQYMVGLCLYI